MRNFVLQVIELFPAGAGVNRRVLKADPQTGEKHGPEST